ncbi:glutamine-hydrolyzing carbamoyl-phosphate synthase small subunit [Saltatorellus ferox]|uniref:glutamine-hydrolyzing carbamoyl-phosphate synthase small subunit n=1 Tax=Saltatorellus ferox TaxID=2528018 RepID=UPI003AF372F1
MTSSPHDAPAWLALENGLVVQGRSIGADGEASGDLVFNTAMTGYQEILTDPSYAGQGVVLTYPLIGNYGIADEDMESGRAWAEALVIKELSSISSNHRATETLDAWLRRRGVVAIEGVDTRRITKAIREEGSLRFVISTTDSDPASLVAKAKAAVSTDGRDLASEVTCAESYSWTSQFESSFPSTTERWQGERLKCVAYDFGAKRNILRSLVHTGFDVTVVPAKTSAAEVLAMNPDGVFLSNGPGDPSACTYAVEAARELVGKTPVFGICLGHQILSLALGAKTKKMAFGHHGANHPVRDETTGRIEITSQNHSYVVDESTMPAEMVATHWNLNDMSLAGMKHRDHPVFSVQYHPEAAPGPGDSAHLFTRFREMILAQVEAQ